MEMKCVLDGPQSCGILLFSLSFLFEKKRKEHCTTNKHIMTSHFKDTKADENNIQAGDMKSHSPLE